MSVSDTPPRMTCEVIVAWQDDALDLLILRENGVVVDGMISMSHQFGWDRIVHRETANIHNLDNREGPRRRDRQDDQRFHV